MNRLHLLASFARAGADLNRPDAHGRQVVDILSERTSNASGLRELLDLGLRSTESALQQARARNAKLIAQALEEAR